MAFVILSMPRSRSAWLAHFLRYGGKRVGHDLLINCRSIRDFIGAFERGDVDGSCETGAMLGWKLLKKYMPAGTRLIAIHRPLNAVMKSLDVAGFPFEPEEIEDRYDLLREMHQDEEIEWIEYDDLNDPLVCKQLFEECLGLPFDWTWWRMVAETNIQVDLTARIIQLTRNRKSLAWLKSEVRCELEKLDGRQGWLFN
jgi:hypothetical protein